MIVFDTVLCWILRIIAAAAFTGAICMAAVVLINEKKIREEEARRREALKRLREADEEEWEDL